jgi:3-oxoadipate enol-lactonase
MSFTVSASDGARLAVESRGPADAQSILFLYSIGCTRDMWAPQVERLSLRFRCLTFDARGHGGSDAPAGDYALSRLGLDVLAVLDAFDVERTHLCGLSLGGAVAQWVALHGPERVDRLVLANTAGRIGAYETWEARRGLVIEQGLAAIADMAMERFFSPAFRAAHPDVVARFRGGLLACDPAGYAGCCAALRDANLTGELHRIAAPTLVIGGSDDVSTPPAQTQALADAIPGARSIVLPAGHLSNVEQPEAFTSALVNRLESAHG